MKLLYPVINCVMVNVVENLIQFKLSVEDDNVVIRNENNRDSGASDQQDEETDDFRTPWGYKIDVIHTDTEFDSDDDKLNDSISVRNITVKHQLWGLICSHRRHMISFVAAFLTVLINAFVSHSLWSQICSFLLPIALLLICYLIPAIMYLKIVGMRNWRQPKPIGALVIVLAGVVLMIGGTTVKIWLIL